MPSVPTSTSTSPCTPASATAPGPPGPSAPVACASSTITRAPYARPSSTIRASGATSPSIEKTESVTISRLPVPRPRRSDCSRCSQSRCRYTTTSARDARQPSMIEAWLSWSEKIVSPGSRECADRAKIGEVARTEQDARLASLERGQTLLQRPVNGHRARHESGGAGAHPPAHRGVGRRLTHPGMVREAKVVVGAQQQDRLAVEQHARSLWS